MEYVPSNRPPIIESEAPILIIKVLFVIAPEVEAEASVISESSFFELCSDRVSASSTSKNVINAGIKHPPWRDI